MTRSTTVDGSYGPIESVKSNILDITASRSRYCSAGMPVRESAGERERERERAGEKEPDRGERDSERERDRDSQSARQ